MCPALKHGGLPSLETESLIQVEVSGSTVFEAAVRALRAFRNQDWRADAAYWTDVANIILKQPEVSHRVLVKRPSRAGWHGNGG